MQLGRYVDGIGGSMDLGVIEALIGGIAVGALAAVAACAALWSRRLKAATQRMARLEQARQQTEQHGARLASQNEQMRREIAELRHQAERERSKRQAATRQAPVAEAEDLLFMNSRPPPSETQIAAAEQFPATMIQPRRPPDATGADEQAFPSTVLVPRKT